MKSTLDIDASLVCISFSQESTIFIFYCERNWAHKMVFDIIQPILPHRARYLQIPLLSVINTAITFRGRIPLQAKKTSSNNIASREYKAL